VRTTGTDRTRRMTEEAAGSRQTMRKVLIVEDDDSMAVALRDGFEYEGYEVVVARDGSEGMKMATGEDPDLIILDVMLPKITGLDICKQLRNDGNDVPIIMLTARGQEVDKVLGLKLGADDYVTKPFSFMELMARVEAVLRRTGKIKEEIESYEFGDIRVDFRQHEVRKAGNLVDFSAREFRLLEFFIEHRGEVISRDQLLDGVWGYENMPFTRTVDMHIAKLRKKIEDDPHDPQHLVTVHRVGYKFTG
jgi:two-component system alkaline phosphatase synthesis response regulator PhoP